MRTTSTKLGSLAALLLAACAGLHAPHAAAQAQNAQRCTTIDDDADRLACYDRALRPTPAPTPARPPTPVAAATAPAPAATPPPAAPPAAPAAPAARRAPTAPPKAETPDVVPIVIVQIRALPGRGATFVTDKGETWVQTDAQRQWPDVPFKASIKAGSMSSVFLVPENYARSFRVHRGQ